MSIAVRHGDCLDVLRDMPDNSVDSIVTDPPYGLSNTKPAQVADVLKAWVAGDDNVVPEGRGFMGQAWDGFVPPPVVWKECLRVLEPGGYMAVFSGARTQDLMGLSIRLAGFEIRDTLGWIYGSGFPKSHDIGKAIDKRPGVHHHREFAAHLKERREAAGLSRQDVAEHVVGTRSGACWNWEHHQFPKYEWWPALRDLLGLDDEKWGPIIAEADREVVGTDSRTAKSSWLGTQDGTKSTWGIGEWDVTTPATSEAQRWDGWGTALKPAIEPIILARKSLDGTVAANVLLDGQSDDSSRFSPVFKYQAKAPKRERPVIEREDGSKIQHATVKPLALMEWLVELITPPNGTILDPFAGSGSTLEAARNKGFNSIGIEREADYIRLIEARLDHQRAS